MENYRKLKLEIKIEENKDITHYRFYNKKTLILILQTSNKLELKEILSEIKKHISKNKKDSILNLCCDENCDISHYWYVIKDIKIRTPYKNWSKNIGLIETANSAIQT